MATLYSPTLRMVLQVVKPDHRGLRRSSGQPFPAVRVAIACPSIERIATLTKTSNRC